MVEYSTRIAIDAPPERVWQILTDAGGYAEWNPEIFRIDGRIAAGAKITTHVRLGGGVERKISLRVTELEPPKRMVWVGGIPLGLFVGRRTYRVTPAGAGSEFQLHLRMSGPLSGPIAKSVGDRQPEVDSFAAGLKKRAERRD